jgi:hypothetical protein
MHSAVAGGQNNIAAGENSFAAGTASDAVIETSRQPAGTPNPERWA